MEETIHGRAIAAGIRLGELTPIELCDLIYFWLLEGKDENQAMKDRGKFEIPPKGWKGSLKNTSWDPDALNAQVTKTTTTVSGEMT